MLNCNLGNDYRSAIKKGHSSWKSFLPKQDKNNIFQVLPFKWRVLFARAKRLAITPQAAREKLRNSRFAIDPAEEIFLSKQLGFTQEFKSGNKVYSSNI